MYGLHGKKDVSIFILHTKGPASPIQEAQVTTVLPTKAHNLAIEDVFDNYQDTFKALFRDKDLNKANKLLADKSINVAEF